MNVLLDTNVYLADLTLDKAEFVALSEYLSRSKSNLLLPQTVRDEIDKNIAKTIEQDLSKLANLTPVKLGMIDNLPDRDMLQKALEKKYKSFFSKNTIVIAYDELSLQELVNRSIKETPPFKTQGRGFRDALIWYSLLQYLKNNPNETLAFISNNTQDFGGEQLKHELVEELKSLGYEHRVKYYRFLNNFLDEHGKSIDFIDDAFIEDSLQETLEEIGANANEHNINIPYPDPEVEWEVLGVEWIDQILDNHYIYREDDENYYVIANITMVYEIILRGMKMDYGYSPYTNDFEWYPKEYSETVHTGEGKEFEMKIKKSNAEVTILR